MDMFAGFSIGKFAPLIDQATSAASKKYQTWCGERYNSAAERRYTIYGERFQDLLGPLENGRPPAPAVNGAAPGRIDMPRVEWGSNNSEITLTRERRKLGECVDATLREQCGAEARRPIGWPELYLLSALVRWCERIDRCEPAADLPSTQGGLQVWLTRVITILQADGERQSMQARCVQSSDR
jgi:hypothetical protein